MKLQNIETVGYGDPRCFDCPKASSYKCRQVVLLTKLQVTAGKLKVLGHSPTLAQAGHLESAQNEHAIQLGCKPATDRI